YKHPPPLSSEDALSVLSSADSDLKDYTEKLSSLASEKAEALNIIEQLSPLLSEDFRFEDLFNMKFITFRYGKIPLDSYKKLLNYIESSMSGEAIISQFFVDENNREYTYGMYFAPELSHERADSIFSSLHFERVPLSATLQGTPKEEYEKAKETRKKVEAELSNVESKKQYYIKTKDSSIASACKTITVYDNAFNVRKYALTASSGSFSKRFALVGWMSEKDSQKLLKDTENDSKVMLVVDEDKDKLIKTKPPTKLKNFFLFKPFELYIEMYGLPSYGEYDPTTLVALTYAFFFGMMFGDLGQGIILCLLGFLLYAFKRMRLAGILGFSGIFSCIFGVLFGSVFGSEEIIKPLWTNPLNGDTMQVLLASIVIGCAVIVGMMVINVINALKEKNYAKAIFNPNGLAGLAFYLGVLIYVGAMFLNFLKVSPIIVISIILVALLSIFLQEPLSNLLERKGEILPKKGKGMFFVQAFFELFEILLSFITNTVSFIRVGGFALSHAGMMSVVYILAQGSSPVARFIILIIGNILIMGLEGLVVAIQSLRLEYYEMFSRFYSGAGRPFKPYKLQKIWRG
ncbi:MAG: V-type ATPase 116kDa subunit family protein, partial [Bacillota bacterium]|nr:V-type ATPase 116kDa subunit family protein [Bacillota bacterium]